MIAPGGVWAKRLEQAPAWIGALYAVEAQIRDENLTGQAKRERRTGLEVYRDDPDAAIDANHLDRTRCQTHRHRPEPAGDLSIA